MLAKAVTVKQIQRLDRIAIDRYGIPSIILMENAGRAVAREVLKLLKKRKNHRVRIVCGQGNNAGDGLVAARHLMNDGLDVKVFIIGKGSCLKEDAAVNYRILKLFKYPVVELGPNDTSITRDIKKAGVVVDAIFGVGLNREVPDPIRKVIEIINKNAKKVVAVDIPSGLDGSTGKIYGACVKADVTVCFSLLKKGFLKNDGPAYIGKVVVADIGIPKWAILSQSSIKEDG